jgi:hypothetical protein
MTCINQGGFIMSSIDQTPDQNSPETSTAVADPSAADAGSGQRSFAEKVGRRNAPSIADPFVIAVDAVAGIRLFESRQDRQMAIKFGEGRAEDKPSQAVIDKLKEAGFRWNRTHRIWARPLTPESSMSIRIDAERLYQELRGMIRQEKGIETSPEVPF